MPGGRSADTHVTCPRLGNEGDGDEPAAGAAEPTEVELAAAPVGLSSRWPSPCATASLPGPHLAARLRLA